MIDLMKKPWIPKTDNLEKMSEENVVDYKWTHETYIAHSQIQDAIDDSDVEICNIEGNGNGGPVVFLELTD